MASRSTRRALTAEELGHLHAFAEHDRLREICALACIEYGRVDFSLQRERIQVWEINTNPTLALTRLMSPEVQETPYGRRVLPGILAAVFATLRSLDLDADPRIRIPVPVTASSPRPGR